MHNAGITWDKLLVNTEPPDGQCPGVNLFAQLRSEEGAARPGAQRRLDGLVGGGRIVTASSIGVHRGQPRPGQLRSLIVAHSRIITLDGATNLAVLKRGRRRPPSVVAARSRTSRCVVRWQDRTGTAGGIRPGLRIRAADALSATYLHVLVLLRHVALTADRRFPGTGRSHPRSQTGSWRTDRSTPPRSSACARAPWSCVLTRWARRAIS